jgi:hypothetical protein
VFAGQTIEENGDAVLRRSNRIRMGEAILPLLLVLITAVAILVHCKSQLVTSSFLLAIPFLYLY